MQVKIRELISSFFFYFGLVMFALLLVSTIHELGHYLNAKKLNATVDNVCVLGWNWNVKSYAWVMYYVDEEKVEEAKKFDKWWDCVWTFGLDRSVCK
jgi:hypothetical protein